MSIFSIKPVKVLLSVALGVGVATAVASLVPTSDNSDEKELTSKVLTSGEPAVNNYQESGKVETQESTSSNQSAQQNNSSESQAVVASTQGSQTSNLKGKNTSPKPANPKKKTVKKRPKGFWLKWWMKFTSNESRRWGWSR
ncbi:hypothetical protein HF1_12190 [Mycoplasma haemofelis str. Langford 1]|uniref:Uncharacterized protein n=1 Tax=Mycoplasma haemofelis (strain Langford 1) TaxID=941640 RepID=E8ZJA6_MYCHL|nr:hypothetical protein [Mycoplasma haemofelis]CBY93227.1 hypothetical protein HF1_12190 [Mycoplasma haemofelis str. Langford 1]